MIKIVKFFLLSSWVLYAGTFGDDGYLYRDNTNSAAYCEALPLIGICKMRNRTVEFYHSAMSQKSNHKNINDNINSTFKFLDMYSHPSNACRESIVDYLCSDINICDNANSSFSSDAERKKKACLKGKQECSGLALTYVFSFVSDCKDITWQSAWLPHCVPLPHDTEYNICPDRTYKVQSVMTQVYSHTIKGLQTLFNSVRPYISRSCFQKYTNIHCYVAGGPVCSDDNGRLSVHVISEQQCKKALQECVPHGRKEAAYFLNVCSGLPDEETAQKVPLPSNINAKSILEPPTSGDGLRNGHTSVLLVLVVLSFVFAA